MLFSLQAWLKMTCASDLKQETSSVCVKLLKSEGTDTLM